MNDSWDDVRLFLAVAETGSLSAAARRLGVSQPTVGRRVRALERRLGTRLFDRRPEGLRPTPAGERAVAPARALERAALALETEVRGEDQKPEGLVRLAATTTLGSLTLAPCVAEIRRRLPGVRLELLFGLGLVDVLRREADVVLRQSRPGSPELVGRKLARIAVGLYATDAYLETHGVPRRREDLARHTLVEAGGELERLPGAAWLRASRGRREPALRCSELLGVRALVREGLGIGVLPGYVAKREPGLRAVLPRQARWLTDLWVLTHRDLRRTRRVREVMDVLSSAYARL